MIYHGFTVDSDYVDGDSLKWKLTGNGEFIIGAKGGKKYFIKRNMHVRCPTGKEPKAVYDKYKAESDGIMNKQKKLAKNMSGLTASSDHIVVEEQNFWDEDHMFVTVSACIAGILPDTFDYTTLSQSQFLDLAKESAVILKKLHARKVIHGDLKEKNVVVVNSGTKYVPYLIDFDSSYTFDNIPEWESIGGSEGYQSPEILLYGSDEGAAEPSTITSATDIFTLAVVFHRWWSGTFPNVDLDGASVGAAVYLDKNVSLAAKFDSLIGDNCGATLMSLMTWMLAKDPSARPTAEQVLDVLSDKLEVPDAYQKGSDVKPFDTELWPAHKLMAELRPVDVLKSNGVKSFKRVNTAIGSKGLKYQVSVADGSSSVLTIDELIAKGYANALSATVEEPWEEDEIEFVSADEMMAKGYAIVKRALFAYRKRYYITTTSGLIFDRSKDWLIKEGLAKVKTVAVDEEITVDTPWPEHGAAYVLEEMSRRGVKSISRVEIGGEHRYKVVYNEIVDGRNRVNESVSANNLKLMGFLK